MLVIVNKMGAQNVRPFIKMKKEDNKSRAISAQQILEMDIKVYPTLVEGIIPKKGVAALAGSSDLGKSYLLQQLSVAVASGAEQFIGFKLNITKPSALYISTEDDDFAMGLRLHHLKALGTAEGMNNLHFIFDAQDLVKSIKYEIELNPVSLIVIDAFADVFKGALNDTISVRNFMEPYKLIAQEHECAIIFNHHCGKHNQYKIPSKDNLLGSQGFESSMRTVIELRQDLKDEDRRHLCIVKGNNMGNDSKRESYELEFNFEKGFTNTGQRSKFQELVLNKNSYNNDEVYNKIAKLRTTGMSVRKMSETLKVEGIEMGKTKVAEMVNKQLADTIRSDKSLGK